MNRRDRPTRQDLEAEEAAERLETCLDAETHGAELDETGDYCLLCGHRVDPNEPVAAIDDEPHLGVAA